MTFETQPLKKVSFVKNNNIVPVRVVRVRQILWKNRGGVVVCPLTLPFGPEFKTHERRVQNKDSLNLVYQCIWVSIHHVPKFKHRNFTKIKTKVNHLLLRKYLVKY